ncbi:hypothetical protein PRZ48_010384 [Zasmidium cellare]|uniref:Nucleoside phosphorylase domain-containing protein n=1 Tax=Zasmidium cellare TaxID=395010 RepID=A0ABR0E8I0_ZASCE|nr:hypothetical protein PRZ48_010384 [Zasmidium cellare]
MSPKRLNKEDYTVGWICALPIPELQASRLLFDGDEHEDVILGHDTLHQYVYGEMNGHNIVMGCLPASQMGKASAAAVAAEMTATFPKLKFGLLVGIGGAVPAPHDIRLGDVVVGLPDLNSSHGGLIQYDFGKAVHDGTFVRTGQLNQPHISLLSGLGKVRSAPRAKSEFLRYLDTYKEDSYWKPAENDYLFGASYKHVEGQDTCASCDPDQIKPRPKRSISAPTVHYGLIASGDQVMKDAAKRDALSAQYSGVFAFEMEAAGIANILPCLVVRGMCDYCDSHKNKAWQPFSAAAAAAWTKELLRNIVPIQRNGHMLNRWEQRAETTQETWMQQFVGQLSTAKRSGNYDCNEQRRVYSLTTQLGAVDDVRKLIDRISSYEPRKVLNRISRKKLQGTTEWLTSVPAFVGWESGSISSRTTAIRRMMFTAPTSKDTVVVHHFFQYPNIKAADLFRSLSKQLIQLHIAGNELCSSALVHDLDLHFGDCNRSPDLDELVDDVMIPLTYVIEKLIICVDGIDMNEEREQSHIWAGLRKLLEQRSQQQKATKLLITAENESHVATLLPSNATRIRLDQGLISNDIEMYIDARLQERVHPRQLFHNTHLRERVKETLLQRAENM